jgi:hypothetical protein
MRAVAIRDDRPVRVVIVLRFEHAAPVRREVRPVVFVAIFAAHGATQSL